MHKSYKILTDRLCSSGGIIFANTFEESRLIMHIKKTYQKDRVFFWSISQGLHEIPKQTNYTEIRPWTAKVEDAIKTKNGKPTTGNPLEVLNVIQDNSNTLLERGMSPDVNADQACIYILRDMHKHFQNPIIERKFRDIVKLVSVTNSPIICTGPDITIPSTLQKESYYLEMGLPDKEDINNLILEKLTRIKLINKKVKADGKGKEIKIPSSDGINKIVNACAGLTLLEIINALSYSIQTTSGLDPETILFEKQQIIQKNKILEFWPCKKGVDSIGGFGEYKKWFSIQKNILDNPDVAKEFNANPPKGCLILGVQGSGKTAMIKASANAWGKAVVKLDMGRVFDSTVGSSERNMRNALAQAEAVGGVIIIDELDKGMAGAAGSDKTDGGTTKRVIGSLLTWMQEPHPGVFIAATANDVSQLIVSHPELFRKGRFDQIFFSDIPTRNERKEIYKIHIANSGRDVKNFDLDVLADTMYEDDNRSFSHTGAEIEHIISEAISIKFSDALLLGKKPKINGKYDIKTEDIVNLLKTTIPIVKLGDKVIRTMREWSNDNARNVSSDIIENNKIDLNKNNDTSITSKVNLNMDDLI